MLSFELTAVDIDLSTRCLRPLTARTVVLLLIARSTSARNAASIVDSTSKVGAVSFYNSFSGCLALKSVILELTMGCRLVAEAIDPMGHDLLTTFAKYKAVVYTGGSMHVDFVVLQHLKHWNVV